MQIQSSAAAGTSDAEGSWYSAGVTGKLGWWRSLRGGCWLPVESLVRLYPEGCWFGPRLQQLLQTTWLRLRHPVVDSAVTCVEQYLCLQL